MKLTKDIDAYGLTPYQGTGIYEVVSVLVRLAEYHVQVHKIDWEQMLRNKDESRARYGKETPRGIPLYFAIGPHNNQVWFDPVPDDDYDVSFRYVSLHEL